MRRKALLATAFALTALVVAPARAAHSDVAPELVSSDPADGATLHESPSEVVLQFSEPLDSSSSLIVRDECGRRIDDGNVQIFVTEMRVGIAAKRSGKHVAAYEAVGIASLTGSTEGSISYHVHLGRSCDGGGGGHSGHGNGGNKEGRHEGHGGGNQGQHGGGGHETGSSGGGGAHSGNAHSTSHDSDGRRGGKGKHGKHKDHRGHGGAGEEDAPTAEPDPETPTVALGDGPAGADGSAVLVALSVAAVLGAMGGWLLRETAPRS